MVIWLKGKLSIIIYPDRKLAKKIIKEQERSSNLDHFLFIKEFFLLFQFYMKCRFLLYKQGCMSDEYDVIYKRYHNSFGYHLVINTIIKTIISSVDDCSCIWNIDLTRWYSAVYQCFVLTVFFPSFYCHSAT